MNRKWNYRWLLWMVPILAITIFIFWKNLPPNRSLDLISQDLGIAYVRRADGHYESNHWISDSEVLKVTMDPQWKVEHLGTVNRWSHQEQRLDVLEKVVKSAAAGGGPNFSPDGKRAICWAVSQGPPLTGWLVSMDLDGSHVVKWPVVIGGYRNSIGAGWLPDSSAYFIAFVDRILIFPIQGAPEIKRFAIPKLNPEQRCMGAIPDGILFSGSYSKGLNIPVTLVRWNRTPPDTQKYDANIPVASRIRNVITSPNGEKLAWCVTINNRSNGLPWIDSIFGFMGRQTPAKCMLLVSRKDGSEMREVGNVANNDLNLLQWSKSGDQLIYVRNRHLFSVRVPD